jgi:ATPase family AAA domain-containing protein 3A/B
VTELHKLFKWVHRSRRGVLLFIDEADAFLSSRKRGNMSEPLRNALTTMLYHTGTASSQFMMVLATNRPHDLDSAILDRIDESVEFGLPDVKARTGLVKLYFNSFITKPLKIKPLRPEDLALPAAASKKSRLSPLGKSSLPEPKREDLVDEETLIEVARRLHGFSGREIAKLMTSLQTHVLYSCGRAARQSQHFLEKKMFFDVVDAKVLESSRKSDFQVTGYDYQAQVDADKKNHTPLHTPNGKDASRSQKGSLLESPTASLNINTAA